MTPERLLALYARVAEAPGSISSLRQFVLNLAVRGRLVEQDPTDEDVSNLLERVAEEKKRFKAGGKATPPKASLFSKNPSLELPKTWKEVPLGEVMLGHLGGGTPSKTNESYWGGDVRWASVKDIKFKYLDDTQDRITESGLENSSSNLIEPGNILVVTRMGLGKVSINRVPVAINQDIRAIFFSDQIQLEYAYIYFRTCSFEGTGLTVKGIRLNELLGLPFPVPPLAEQARIVARVDELMGLLDKLEAARSEREATRKRLTTASLARLTATETDPEAYQSHVLFALDALPALTSRPDQIQLLRQATLRLAVRGKLVEQDPSDESASVLLDRIAERRTELLDSDYPNASEAKKQKRKQAQQAVPAGLSELPIGWEWATLQECSLIVVDCKNKTAPYSSEGTKLIRTTNIRDGKLNSNDIKFVTEKTYNEWSLRTKPEPGDILITREAPMGEVCIIPDGEKVCLGQRIMLVRLVPKTIDVRFLLYSLRDPELLERVQDKPIGMTVEHLRVGGIETLLVPVPPLQEQRRIVAKLDELMALCDGIEGQLKARKTCCDRLLKSLLSETLRFPVKRSRAA